MTQARRAGAAIAAVLVSLLMVGFVAGDSTNHTVVAGDTLGGISQLYGVSVTVLTQVNHIANPDLIFPGQQIQIPSDLQGSGGREEYQVQAGDTLSEIALRSGVDLDELMAANSLNADLIFAGQTLVIPRQPPAASSPQASERPHSPELESLLEDRARAEALDPGLLKALAWVESGWQQGARSPAGAIGIMQLMPGTAEWLERDVLDQDLDEEFSAYDNVKLGARLVHILIDKTGSEDSAIAAYYQGYGTTAAGTLYAETKDYVAAVKAVRAAYWP